MRVARVVVVAVVALMMACRGRESVTGSYGDGVVTGQVVMASEMASASPAGVQVTVEGTGMTALLGPDGRFAFAGVPDNAVLHFSRPADNIDLRLAIAGNRATPIVVELGGSGGHHRAAGSSPPLQVEGTVVTASATSITIHDSHGNDVTLAITAATLIRKGRENVPVAALVAGTRVHAKAVDVDGVKTAQQIVVQETAENEPGDDHGHQTMTANGTVTAVGSSDLTVRTEEKGSVTVKTDANTIIRKQGTTVHLSDIVVGDEVNSVGTRVDDHTLLAKQIEVRGKGHH